eukprot:11381441-Alexandrium_andersonii.AAC.1
MSASLVGSEMCIRDSPTTSSRSPSATRSSAVAPATAGHGSGCDFGMGACLLYTSDAADDM